MIVSSRFFAILAVFGSMAAAVLMFLVGLYNIFEAFRDVLEATGIDEDASFGTGAVIGVIEGLDRFLIAIVLIYFSYGVYSLFIHPEESEEALALPVWLRVRKIGQLKQVVAEVIVVILFVLFLRVALQTFENPTALDWLQIARFMVLPLSIVLLALASRLVELHPKPLRVAPKSDSDEAKPRQIITDSE